MDTNSFSVINKEVNVSSYYFQNKNFKSFPRQIELEGGARYTFIENGLRLLVRKGQQLIEFFDMTDGQRTFRLRLESGHWTLVSMKAGA